MEKFIEQLRLRRKERQQNEMELVSEEQQNIEKITSRDPTKQLQQQNYR